METEKKWNPGHATNKGYPFERIESAHALKDRVRIGQDQGTARIVIDWNREYYPDFANIDASQDKRTDFEDFLLFRLFDAYSALKMAEGQIEDGLFTEDPFTPETFGFELVHKNKDITEPPVRIYASKHNGKVTLFRKPGTPNDPDWNPAMWTIMEKKDDGSFKETDINLPCHRIAFAAFFALGIQIEETEKLSV